MSNTFRYFAYGSNMLAKRMHMNNPSSVRRNIGYIEGYILDFGTMSKIWGGATATLVEKKNSIVWGAIWEVDNCHLATLDEQEGVAEKIYQPIMIDVKTPDDETVTCRSYKQTKILNYIVPKLMPLERRPSPLYLKTIIQGAIESNLPGTYIQYLETLVHNEYAGEYGINPSFVNAV